MSRSADERIGRSRTLVARPDRSRVEYRSWRRCEHCGRPLGVNAHQCQRRTCPGYSETWARDQRRRLIDNLNAYEGRAVMLTLTPPGADHLPWDERSCAHLGPHKHTGDLGCRVIAGYADEWNSTAPERARQLNRVAKQRADRELKRRGIDERRGKLVHAWEHQQRGALHQHFLVGVGTETQDAWGTNVDALWTRLYADAIRELSSRYRFGFIDTRPLYRTPKPAREAAAYLSGYFISGRGKKAAITETVQSRIVPPNVVYVSPKLTRQTYCTMRNLRRARRLFMWRRGVATKPQWKPQELVEVCVVLDRLPPEYARRMAEAVRGP
jgi:hypothetical protein